ncbi:hypothetical protein RESH_01458 [Rhodopirellula europaea SH398]|uniref:Uncharacterized protein n=1 Tax=Rhodopirellula europaea SH398 TaxID=1263868 RepID=M5SJR0_9BACT|nr:hypothetical protein RESH_01458 [Rhodopirellula europaea SH398]
MTRASWRCQRTILGRQFDALVHFFLFADGSLDRRTTASCVVSTSLPASSNGSLGANGSSAVASERTGSGGVQFGSGPVSSVELEDSGTPDESNSFGLVVSRAEDSDIERANGKKSDAKNYHFYARERT